MTFCATVCIQVVSSEVHDFLRVCDGAHEGCDSPIYMNPIVQESEERLPDWAIILIIIGSVVFCCFIAYVCLWRPAWYMSCIQRCMPTKYPPYNKMYPNVQAYPTQMVMQPLDNGFTYEPSVNPNAY